MEIMDPYTSELLSAPALPAAFSGCGAAHQTEFDDDYLRAIGALPPRSRAPATLEPPSVIVPASLDADVIQPAAVEVRRKRAAPAPVSDAAASKRPRTCPWLPDYDADMDINLREKERNVKQPSPDYLKTVQGDRIDERARASLVVWMDEFTRLYDLAPGTLHRAVSYVDRVLSARALSAADSDHELRLLGAAAVFTAAKYEERSTVLRFNAADVAGYCGFATSKEVTDMERRMLATLWYELGGPTACTFVDHFTRNSRGEKNMEIRRLAHQLANTSLRDYGCLRFMPSAVAAAALFLARLILNPTGGQLQNQYFDELTGYKPKDLMDGIYSLLRMNPSSRSVILPALRLYL